MACSRPGLSFALAFTPAIAFTLHDLVLQLPDNQHEASLGFFVTALGLVLVWGLGGYYAARGARDARTSMWTGAAAGAVSVGVLWLTFIALNAAFIDRMSYEPDRIRAFLASGYPTMRAFVFRGQGVVGPFPLLFAVAALAGVGGGLLSTDSQKS